LHIRWHGKKWDSLIKQLERLAAAIRINIDFAPDFHIHKNRQRIVSPHGYCVFILAAPIPVNALCTTFQTIDFTQDKNCKNPIDLKHTKRKFTIVL